MEFPAKPNADSGVLDSHYVIITPCRDDALFLPCIAGSLLMQTIRPRAWVIVDDSSRDSTLLVADSLTRQYDWIRVVSSEPRSEGRSGTGSARAFLKGFEQVKDFGFDFIVNLDVDICLPPDYFERMFEAFSLDKELGICGGHCYEIASNGELRKEWVPDEHVRGATKIYRKACFDEIGGVALSDAWDMVDEIRAQMKGWKTRSFDTPGVLHLRRTGSVGGILKAKARHGRLAHYVGYHPLFVLTRAFRLCFVAPFLFGGIAFLFGFLGSICMKSEQFPDKEMICFLRGQQLRRLLSWRRELARWRASTEID